MIVPRWESGTISQIYPRPFQHSDGVGDLRVGAA